MEPRHTPVQLITSTLILRITFGRLPCSSSSFTSTPSKGCVRLIELEATLKYPHDRPLERSLQKP